MNKVFINRRGLHAMNRAIITESDYVRVKVIRKDHRPKYFKTAADAECYLAKRGYVLD